MQYKKSNIFVNININSAIDNDINSEQAVGKAPTACLKSVFCSNKVTP